MLILSASATSGGFFSSYPGAPDARCVSFQLCLHVGTSQWYCTPLKQCFGFSDLACLLATSLSEKIIPSEQQRAEKHVTSRPAALPSQKGSLLSAKLQLLIFPPSRPGRDLLEVPTLTKIFLKKQTKCMFFKLPIVSLYLTSAVSAHSGACVRRGRSAAGLCSTVSAGSARLHSDDCGSRNCCTLTASLEPPLPPSCIHAAGFSIKFRVWAEERVQQQCRTSVSHTCAACVMFFLLLKKIKQQCLVKYDSSYFYTCI